MIIRAKHAKMETEKIRRHFTPKQKVSILREHLIEHTSVSDVCDKRRTRYGKTNEHNA